MAMAVTAFTLSCCGTKEKQLLDSTPIREQGFINNEQISGIGDPYLVVDNGKYYVTATCDGNGYDLYSSDDCMNWTNEGRIFSSSATEGWVRSSLWQPQIVKGNDGKYYLYYCGNNARNSLRIGVAVADSITGPYKDALDHPLVEFGVATIDPYFYTDDDGKMYLYFSRDCSENIVDGYNTSQLYGIEMADYVSVKEGAQAVLLITPDQEWELNNGNYRWNEGPDILKHDGKYYLFYSGGFYGDSTYSMGYAVADVPLGPYAKYENNPIIQSTDDTSGPGNNSFFYSLDGKELYTCYHTHTNKILGGGDRKVTIDRCGFRKDGTFFINGPTIDYQTPISGHGTLTKIENIASLEGFGTLDGRSVNALMDGETLNSKNQSEYEWRIGTDENAGLQINLSGKTTLDCIYIYGTHDAEYAPASIKVIFSENQISEVTVPAGQTSPTVLYFEPVETDSVRIEVEDLGTAKGLGLSEIALYNTNK